MTPTLTQVAGMPAVHVATDGGTCSGGLVFRVGWADETLAVRGLTHLVGHLVLATLPPSEVHHHLEISANHTVLRADGGFEDVTGFVARVCSALRDLPVDRVEEVKEVLAAETVTGRPVGGLTQQARYGARGYGLSAYPEVGLPEIDPELAQVWAQEAFSRGNAVLWFCGDRSPELVAVPLPEGPRQPLPPVPPSLSPLPGYLLAPESDTVVLSAVLRRTAATAAFAHVLDGALDDALRERTGYCVRAGARYDVRDGSAATVVVRADCVPDRRVEALGELVDVLASLRWGTLDARALTAARTDLLEEPDPATLALDAARDLLLSPESAQGVPVERRPTEVRAVSAAALAEVAAAFGDGALGQVPETGLGWLGWSEVAHPSTGLVEPTGDGSPPDGQLVVTGDGVSLTGPAGTVRVPFERVSAMVSYADGGRWLVGDDGTEVHVEPGVHGLGPDDAARIDAAVDVARVIHRPARAGASLPTATAPDAPPEPERATPLAGRILGRLRGRR